MKILIVLLFLLSPLKKVENVQLYFLSDQNEIFLNYSNGNFSQRVFPKKDRIIAETKNLNFLDIDLNFRIILDSTYINGLDIRLKDLVLDLFDYNLDNYMKNISGFLNKSIRYSDNGFPQDALSVLINKKANCIGFSNLVVELLYSVGIESRFIKGFHLENKRDRVMIPIPHRWIEILLSNGFKYFYDPQYQNFSSGYIIVKNNVDFSKVKKFKVHLLKKSSEIIN